MDMADPVALEAPEDMADPAVLEAPADITEDPVAPDSAAILTDRPCRPIIPIWVVDGTALTITEAVAVAFSP